MRPDLPSRASHDDVKLTRRERRVMAHVEADLAPNELPTARANRHRERSDPAALLFAGLVVLAGAAIATSELLAGLGIALSLGALVRSALTP